MPFVNSSRTFSCFLRLKKEGESIVFVWLFYGRFLSSRIASTTPIMIITIITAAIPYSRLANDAKPVTGVGYGAIVPVLDQH